MHAIFERMHFRVRVIKAKPISNENELILVFVLVLEHFQKRSRHQSFACHLITEHEIRMGWLTFLHVDDLQSEIAAISREFSPFSAKIILQSLTSFAVRSSSVASIASYEHSTRARFTFGRCAPLAVASADLASVANAALASSPTAL